MKSLSLAEIYHNCVRLLDSGWTIPQIDRLSQFRNRFQQTSEDMLDLDLDIKHLKFYRWLVQTGRLSVR